MRLDTLDMSLYSSRDKEIAIERYTALGLPTKKSEAYRYFDTKSLLAKEYETLEYPTPEIQEGEKVEIVDGVVISAPKGLRIYYEAGHEVDGEHFDALYYLGHILSTHVIKIEIDGDAQIEIEHRYTQSNALIHYRIVLVNQSNRHASVYEHFAQSDIHDSLVLYGYDMEIAPDSTLRMIKEQTLSQESYAVIASHKISVAKQANMILRTFDFAGGDGLQLLKIDLDTRATIEASHLLYSNATSRRGTVSAIVHQGEHSHSKQEAKSILDANARGIFDALIKVEASAKHTKAVQNSNAILLHEKAYMASKPQLEIYIDELEASHGATTGQLSQEALFYLQSRGLSYDEARKMLVMAFANTLIEKIKDARYQKRIQEAFEMVFYRK